MARKEIDKRTILRSKDFAKKLRDARAAKDLSQSDLSFRSNVPLDTVRSIENGRIKSPGIFIAADLVHALDGRLDEWLSFDEREKKRKSK